MQMALPRMDVPISVVEWELFVPGGYQGRQVQRQRDCRAPHRGVGSHRWTDGNRHRYGGGTDDRHSTSARQFTANDPAGRSGGRGGRANEEARRESRDQDAAQLAAAPSANVQSLQRRAAGVLPVRIDVPRAGTSHRFLKPLVVDEETVVQFRYPRR